MRAADYQPLSIVPDVIALEPSDYEKGIRIFISKFQKAYEGEAAFYQFGKLRTSGVSDIDMMIVVRDEKWKGAMTKALQVIRSDGFLSYLFVHEPLVISESLLPHMKFFMSLHLCAFLESKGNWNPVLAEHQSPAPDGVKVIKECLYNGNQRIFSSVINRRHAGLRSVLLHVHGLLTVAERGNACLARPISINIKTEEMRREILSASRDSQAILCREYIRRTIWFLSEVNKSLAEEFLAVNEECRQTQDLGGWLDGRLMVPDDIYFRFKSSRIRHIFTPLFKRTEIYGAGTLSLYLAGRVGEELSGEIPNMAPMYRRYLQSFSLRKELDIREYADRVRSAKKIFDKHRVEYMPILFPFAHHKRCRASARQEIVRRIRGFGVQAVGNPHHRVKRSKSTRKVSVVIPVYNRIASLRAALESVRWQTFSDYEVLVIQNGSKEGVVPIIDELKKKGMTIKYFYQTQPCAAAARNLGIAQAEGEYIAFLDDDDTWLPEKLKQQVECLDKNPDVGLVTCRGWRIDEEDKIIDQIPANFFGDPDLKVFVRVGCVIYTLSGVMVRRDSFDKIGMFNEEYKIGNDYDFYIRLAQQQRIRCLPQPLLHYRQHAASLSQQKAAMMWSELVQIVRSVNSDGHEDIAEQDIRKAVRHYAGRIFQMAREAAARGQFLTAAKYYAKGLGCCLPGIRN